MRLGLVFCAVVAALVVAVTFPSTASKADDEINELHPLGAEEGDGQPLLAELARVPGFDISWPQCGKDYPPGPVAFAIIGLNNGKPFTANPCFLHQFRWAQRVEKTPSVYINTAFPKPGESNASAGPYGACSEEDGWCRGYNYGWNLAKDSILRAEIMRVSPSHWWLDVESGNYWSDDPQNNSQVIRGAIDYFKQRSLPVGIYGTPYQWRILVGTFASPGIAIWTAGAQGIDMAASRCDPQYAFAGGTVAMVQYYDWGFDTNYICPGSESLFRHPQSHPHAGGPRGRTSSMEGSTLRFWNVLPQVSN